MNSLTTLQGMLLRAGGSALSRGKLLILIYHRVLAQRDALLPGEPTAAEFAAQMDLLKSLCHVLPLGEAVERLRRGSLPPRAACISFDDGYANNLEIAAPILQARGLPAVVFVASGFAAGGCMWNDVVIEALRVAPVDIDLGDFGIGPLHLGDTASRAQALQTVLPALKYLPPAERMEKAQAIAERAGARIPRQPMMTAAQLRQLGGFGIEVGAHTITHPILTAIDARSAEEEIAGSKAALEAITGRAVTLFAYPNGRPGRDYDQTHVQMVRRCGFSAAVSTAWGASTSSCDPLQLPRMLPWDRSAFRFGLRLVRTFGERRIHQA